MTKQLPEPLILAVDRWFKDNAGTGGCSDEDVEALAELFYGVHHEGGRESVDDALAVVESFGPGIGGLNDAYARQILLAEEVKRLRAQVAQTATCDVPRAKLEVDYLTVSDNRHLRVVNRVRWCCRARTSTSIGVCLDSCASVAARQRFSRHSNSDGLV